MTKTRQLAKLAQRPPVKAGPIEKLIASTTTEHPFNLSTATADDHDVHMGIVRHLGMDFSLGSAVVLLGEARRLTGQDRRARIERAIRHLGEELQHC